MDSHPLAITSPAVLVSEQEAHVASGSMYSVRYGCVVCRVTAGAADVGDGCGSVAAKWSLSMFWGP